MLLDIRMKSTKWMMTILHPTKAIMKNEATKIKKKKTKKTNIIQ